MHEEAKTSVFTAGNHPAPNNFRCTGVNMKRALLKISLIGVLVISGCDYDVPITVNPTRPIEERLLGDWRILTAEKIEHLKIRRFDGLNYVISYGEEDPYQRDFYRAHHSDVAGLALVSVRRIEDEGEGKYCYFAWQVSGDGKRLTLRRINVEIIPKDTADSATIQKLIENNRGNPQLFSESSVYTRQR
jgi:hypothetical protein